MPGVDDWTLAPHKVVEKIFEECGVQGPWRQRVKEHFEQELQQQAVLGKLPWVNESPLHQLRTGQLVRYRGMVQDMFDSEFFLDVYQVTDTAAGTTKLRPGRYRDVVECGNGETMVTEGPGCETGDRQVYYCVPVPGETEWVKQVYQELNPDFSDAGTSGCPSRHKRPVADAPTEDGNTEEGMDTERMDVGGEGGGSKRTRGEEEEGTTEGPDTTQAATNRNGAGASTSATSTTPDLNFPLPGMKGTPCLVKLYEEQGFSLNDVIEVVGILSVDPALAGSGTPQHPGAEEMDLEEEAAHSPPPSLVPRLHTLVARKMSHTNPLVPAVLDAPVTAERAREARETLRGVLQEACLGDALAAELLICHLVSSVYLRQDVIALGKFCLNLSGVDKRLQDQKYTAFLYGLLTRLVTQSHLLSMTLATMNSANFVPKKDYRANRLVAGLLQLSQHTHLVVDETSLSAGQLDTRGVQNLTALGNLINWQKVEYDFQYHQIEQLTNLPVLILSEGRTMVPCDTEVRLEPKYRDVSAAAAKVEELLTPEVLAQARTFLTSARLAPYTLPEDMQKMVQDDFVDSRKGDSGLSASDLHNLLILARLIAVSCGETSLTQDVWRSAKILEAERKLRITPASPRQQQ